MRLGQRPPSAWVWACTECNFCGFLPTSGLEETDAVTECGP